MQRFLAIAAGLIATAVIATAAPAHSRPTVHPFTEPALSGQWSSEITNPYLPMVPGTRFIYDGFKGNKPEHDEVYVSHRTKTIIGVPCTIEVDTVHVGGYLVEVALDYYAQDYQGNVWYFGEYVSEYHKGVPKGHKSSWMSGKNGAQPGIIMEATPRVGDAYNQENAPPVAEDRAKVLSVTASASTPYGNFVGNVLKTKEFSPLDPPGSWEHKYYAPGIGFVKGTSSPSAPEMLALTAIDKQQ